MAAQDLFSKDEVLGGLPAQRARTLVFLIESRTAHLLARSKRAMERFLTESAEQERDMAFLEAFSLGKAPPLRPAIQDIERYAPIWASLAPDNPEVRAAAAHVLGEKYCFTRREVPGLRSGLGLDDEAVQRAYHRLYDEPLDAIYSVKPGVGNRLHWGWAGVTRWLEDLPPFWTAFSLTLTETIGAGILALPIALAGLGPVAGIALLIVFGLVNVITIAYMTEAVCRSGNIRYGSAYFGRLVSDYLGPDGSLILSICLVLINVLALLAYFIGLGTTMQGATQIHASIWVGLLFLVDLYFLKRESLNATVSAALVVGGVNICLILVLVMLALPGVRIENLAYINIPFLNGRPLDTGILQLAFGVVLAAYFGHTSMGNCAKIVLHRDPGGRSLILGSITAQLVAILLYSIWIFAVNGSIPAAELASEPGTALIPLAMEVGPVVYVLGIIFVVLGMGMGSIHFSLGLYNLAREWLPRQGKTASNRALFAGKLDRFYLGIIPAALVFALTEWLLLSGRESFSEPLSFLGVIVVSILAGAFPSLLLLAARQKGEFLPEIVFRFLSHPVFTVGIYLLSMTGLFLHGFLIWSNPFQRIAAVLAGFVVLGITIVMIRRRVFAPRTNVQIRQDAEAGGTVFAVINMGKLEPAQIHLFSKTGEHFLESATGTLPEFSSLRSVIFSLPPSKAHEIKIWTHKINSQGESEPIPVQIKVESGEDDLKDSMGQVILPLSEKSPHFEIRMNR